LAGNPVAGGVRFHLEHAQKAGVIMASGKVKWFDNRRGYGFIIENSGQDIFVHHTCIEGQGYKTLKEGDPISFEIINSEKGLKADKVQRLDSASGKI
jgi:CspA family cold shock protein